MHAWFNENTNFLIGINSVGFLTHMPLRIVVVVLHKLWPDLPHYNRQFVICYTCNFMLVTIIIILLYRSCSWNKLIWQTLPTSFETCLSHVLYNYNCDGCKNLNLLSNYGCSVIIIIVFVIIT